MRLIRMAPNESPAWAGDARAGLAFIGVVLGGRGNNADIE
jgi:hypothetical protein